MSKEYLESSCHPEELAFYHPIEAAIRWCGLYAHERTILEELGKTVLPERGQFPRWPCLKVNAEKILYAMVNGHLRYCRDGRAVPVGEHVADERKTVEHADLRAWLEREYPDQRPAFLFGRPAISGAGAELLAQSIYWEGFERMAVRTIEQFPVWKKSVKKIQKSGNLYEWLTRDIKASTRQAEILTKVLSDIFEELN